MMAYSGRVSIHTFAIGNTKLYGHVLTQPLGRPVQGSLGVLRINVATYVLEAGEWICTWWLARIVVARQNRGAGFREKHSSHGGRNNGLETHDGQLSSRRSLEGMTKSKMNGWSIE